MTKNRTARSEVPGSKVRLSSDDLEVLDDLALDLEDDLVERMVESEVADFELVEQGLATGRSAWRYEDESLDALRTLQADPWFHY